jgi:hypothetical protein
LPLSVLGENTGVGRMSSYFKMEEHKLLVMKVVYGLNYLVIVFHIHVFKEIAAVNY